MRKTKRQAARAEQAAAAEQPADAVRSGYGGEEGEGRYRRLVETLVASNEDTDRAMHLAIGGEFEGVGLLERDLLIWQGLAPDGFVIDVGCGSGRLAAPLSGYLKGGYLGTDVVPDLLDYARRLVNRPDWRFEQAQGLAIPAPDASADIVCFFSVFTHLRHEESYVYLQEAKRVLRPQGRIIFSFLEFAMNGHWAVFDGNVAGIHSDHPLNQFMSRDAITTWARHLDLDLIEIYDGEEANIPLAQPITFENGETYETMGALGQSIAVLGLP
jgi:SAM-dependent methyltransferase